MSLRPAPSPSPSDTHPAPADNTALRDGLALDRTVLANERTLLAYVRTALALGAAGFTLLAIFENPWLLVTGWLAMVAGTIIMMIGMGRYGMMRQRLRELGRARSN